MNPNQMRAMRLHRTAPVSESPLKAEQAPIPLPGPNDIKIRVSVCGVCHTDLHTVEGDLAIPSLPLIPGHQVVGLVDEVGSEADQFSPGQLVGVAWLGWTCGQCQYCTAGLENLCPEARFTGLHHDGGFAEYLVVDERFAFPIPDSFSHECAAPLMCGGIVGFRSLHLSGVKPGGNLGLYGFGASAHLVIQVARHWNCQVFVFTRGEQHRRLAERLGAAWSGDAEEMPPQPLDGGIIFAPVGTLVPMALKHLRPGGVLAINAIHMSDIPSFPYKLIYHERVVRSVANFTRKDAIDFLRIAAEIPIQCEVEVFQLEEANLALNKLKRSEIEASAVLRII